MAATSDLRLSPIHLLTGLPCAEAAEAPSPSRAEEEDGDGGGAGSPPGSPGGSSRAERGAGEGGAGRSREGLGQGAGAEADEWWGRWVALEAWWTLKSMIRVKDEGLKVFVGGVSPTSLVLLLLRLWHFLLLLLSPPPPQSTLLPLPHFPFPLLLCAAPAERRCCDANTRKDG